MPSDQFSRLDNDPSLLPRFFDEHFPGVTSLISEDDLIDSFTTNPHLPLISLKCKPYHHGSAGVVIGDAAHAMVPFYGQGMNAGMEDVRILFSILDKHAALGSESNNPFFDDVSVTTHWMPSALDLERGRALAEYSAVRAPDAHTINDLALQNYVEMRASVLSRRYRLRKFLEEFMSLHFPGSGWQTKYSRVSFSNEGYAEVVRRSEHQGKVLMRSFYSFMASPFVVGAAMLGYKYRQHVWAVVRGIQLSLPTSTNWTGMLYK
jgi:kynurenine 3-monooxygenase